MNIQETLTTLNSQKSPSLEAMKITYNRAYSNGGVTQDFSANVENIRELSRKMGINILPSITTRNLIKYSEEFNNVIWQKTRTTVSSGITGPFGINNAFKIIENVDVINSNHRFEQDITISPNTNYTISFYAKAAERFFLALNNSDGLSSTTSIFNLTAGTTDTPSRSTISSVGNGWYRCTVTRLMGATVGTGIAQFFLCNDSGVVSYLGNGTSGLYLYGVQYEIGTVATTYQPTKEVQTNLELTSANLLYVPSSYGESKNFVQNPSIRNKVRFSEEFDNATFTKNFLSISVNVILAPNGTLTADKIVESLDVVNRIHDVRDTYVNSYVNKVSTFSIYGKSAERTSIRLASGVNFAIFDLTSGLVTSSTGISRIENVGGGWFRCSITYIPVSSQICAANIVSGGTITYMGDGVSGVYIWGMQVENSPIPTTYQRTTDGISDFTFTRATTSRTTNKLGIIEDSCYNIITNSDPNSDTGSSNVNGITYSAYTWGINGLVNATVFGDDSTQRNRYVSFNLNQSNYTFSFFIKMDDNSIPVQGLTTGTGDFGIVMDGGLAIIPATKTHLGNNIWLISLTKQHLSVGATSTGVVKYTSMSNKSFIASGYQLALGTTRPYLRTTDRLNIPCLDYSRSLLEPSLMIEPQRTNLVIHSETLDNAAWLKPNAPIVANTNLNPFGVNKSWYLTEDTNNTTHYITQSRSITTATPYTASLYIKKATHSWIQIGFGTATFGANAWVNFNFDTASFGNNGGTGSWTSRLLTNGYYLLTFTATSIVTTNNGVLFIASTNNTDSITKLPSYTGTSTNICEIAAIQFETGSNATSYIPTTTATVTRNADTSYVDLWNNNMLNQENFTLYCEIYMYNRGDNGMIGLSDVTTISATNNIFMYSGGFKFYVGGVLTAVLSTMTHNSSHKMIIQVSGTTVKFYRDGVQIGTTQTKPVFNYRYLVVTAGESTYSLDKITLFNRTLSDSECITLTTL